MTQPAARFVDQTAAESPALSLWPALVIPRAAIEQEIARLAALPRPENGRRHSLIVHPSASEPGLGLAPGIRVTLEVLLPGERSRPIRHNSTVVSFCIRGRGTSQIGERRFALEQYDVVNIPSMWTYSHANDGDDIHVRLAYSNAALLEKMNVHVVEDDPPLETPAGEKEEDDAARRNPFGTFQLTEDGAWLMPYEQLINPSVVESKPLHWPWRKVKEHLDQLVGLGRTYSGRRLYLLFNPASGRTNGTTHTFFATMTIRPPGIVDRPHRHTSAAINYYFAGRGRSTVEGERFEWGPGDLMFSAPGWGVHNHASHDEPVYELTIQDSPLNIAMESLLWQENLKAPPAVLGSQRGFDESMMQLDSAFLRGSYPPLATPFRNGEIDYDAFAGLIEQQIAGGSHGLLICGTTAEPSTLTVEERNRLVRLACEVTARRVPVVAATGSQSHAETIALTEAAEKAGAEALLIVTPYYIRPSQRGLIEYYSDVAGRTSLPWMIYHIPGRAAVGVEVDTVAVLAERSPQLVGIKHAVNDLSFVSQLLARLGFEFRVFVGLEELSFPMLALGAAGLMNAVGNLAPRRVADLYEAMARGDVARGRELHYELLELNQSIFFDTNPIPLKYMMKRLGLLERNEHRLPMLPAAAALGEKLDGVLSRAGLL